MATRVLETTIRYLGPCEGKPIFYGRHQELDNLPLEDRTVSVEDLRSRSGACSLDREGFTLTTHQTSLRDFLDPAMRRRNLRQL